jgi:beta-glucosidase-like glycosyl hydrolase
VKGGMIQYYDYPLEVFLNTTIELVANGSVALSTLQSHVRRILGVKFDLGLFDDPYIPDNVNSQALTEAHVPLTLEAAQKSIVLLENRNKTLPIKPTKQNISKIALIGPFSDTLNCVGRSFINILEKSLT